MAAKFAPLELVRRLGKALSPIIIDARKPPDYEKATFMVPSALRHQLQELPSVLPKIPKDREIVVYCAYGGETSQKACKLLQESGINAYYMEGGIAAWDKSGFSKMKSVPECGLPSSFGRPTKWITRERPKIDRVACPWLITRFIDPLAEFLYVPADKVIEAGKIHNAIPYDVPNVRFSHRGQKCELCSFDSLISDCGLDDPALHDVASIVRGADTGKPELTPQSHGLLAMSLGLSHNFPDDHAMLKHGMVMYDALYAWAKSARGEVHNADLFKKN